MSRKKPGEKKQDLKQAVVKRDGYDCLYCQQALTYNAITLDHIVPVSKGGLDSPLNITVACESCNAKRGNQEFFAYLRNFQASKSTIEKFVRLQKAYWHIKVFNVAKEKFLKNEYEVAQDLIDAAYTTLPIEQEGHYIPYYANLLPELISIDFEEYHRRSEIIYAFEQLILLLEDWGWQLSKKKVQQFKYIDKGTKS